MFGRKFSAVLVALVAALLSVTLAVPANAAGLPWKDPVPKTTDKPWYYNNIPYETQVGTGSAVEKVKYDDAYFRQRIANPHAPTTQKTVDNKTVKGVSIQPGKTPVIPKSVTTPKPPAGAGALAAGPLGYLMMNFPLGMGGKAVPPENAGQILQNMGVSTGCIAANGTCTRAELDKIMDVNSCSLVAGKCAQLGAIPPPASTDVLPFDGDLWSMMTGQAETALYTDVHQNWLPTNGCGKEGQFQWDGPGTVTGGLAVRTIYYGTAPSTQYEKNLYNTYCAAALADFVKFPTGRLISTCIDGTGSTTDASGSKYGLDLGVEVVWNGDGSNAKALCKVAGVQLQSVKIWAMQPKAGCISMDVCFYANTIYSEWVNPDPNVNTVLDTTITTDFKCKDALGGVRSYSISLKGSSGYPVARCPEGSQVVDYSMKAKGGDGTQRQLGGGEVNQTELAKYPNCVSGPCTLQVYVDNEPCGTAIEKCQTWPKLISNQPSRVTCHWGPYTVPRSDCEPLANAYLSEMGVMRDPVSNTWVTVNNYGQPIPSNPEPWNPTNPNPVPGTKPGTGGSGGGGTGVGTFPGSGNSPPPSDGLTCMVGAWTWNPIDWVYEPVKCALVWAFVPVPGKLEEQAAIVKTKLESKGIGAGVAIANQAFGVVGAGGGCQGPPVYFAPVDQTFYFFNACDAPMSHVALISRSLVGFSVVGFGLLTSVRMVSAAFGYNFTLGRGGGGDN